MEAVLEEVDVEDSEEDLLVDPEVNVSVLTVVTENLIN
jgi:hypothetical protein